MARADTKGKTGHALVATRNVVMRERRRVAEWHKEQQEPVTWYQTSVNRRQTPTASLLAVSTASWQGTGVLSPLRQSEKDLHQASHLRKPALVDGRLQSGRCSTVT